MRLPRVLVGVAALAALGVGVAIYWMVAPRTPGPPGESPVAAATQDDFSHLPEGSEVFPVDWLRATTSVRTGKPFLHHLDRFGLSDDPRGPPVPGDPGK